MSATHDAIANKTDELVRVAYEKMYNDIATKLSAPHLNTPRKIYFEISLMLGTRRLPSSRFLICFKWGPYGT